MKYIFFYVSVILLLSGCKNSSPDVSGNEKISADDFLKAFPEMQLPVLIADTSLKNFGDTVTISKTVFTQFVADSALNAFANNTGSNFIIHPAGIIHKKDKDFLIAKFMSKSKLQLGVFVLDDKHKFLASLPLLTNLQKDEYAHTLSITEEPTFILKKEKITGNNGSLYSRNGFAYNNTLNSFEQVLHDSNEDTARNNEIINPIDTLPATNKFSGDYVGDKKNFISVRNGKDSLTYLFFVHFEKNNGACIGELKGAMTLKNNKSAVFSESGDPCVINFKFTGNTINIKEEGNCGNHRGITCPFDLSFKKKTPVKKKLNTKSAA
jgi:hypothetical protein